MNRKEFKLNKKVVNHVQQATDNTIKKNNLIEPNDRILIGVSGGIDSLSLLEILANKRKYYNFNFTLKAVHINIENIPYSVEKNQIKDFCDKLNIEIEFLDKKIEINQKLITTNPCFICSWNRRKMLFNYAKEHNFNKLALGHHRDDAIETFMMNLIYHGTISSLPENLSMFDGRMRLIRPLIYLDKDTIREYAEIRGIKAADKTCAYSNATSRKKFASVIDEMKKFNPHVEQNLFKSMSNIFDEYLPKI